MAKKSAAQAANATQLQINARKDPVPIEKNSEILFLYDAEKCNPNGDPDNENKPRMDVISKTNIVTDVRMKRYIRDYLEEYKKMNIFITKPEGLVLSAGDRIKAWIWRKLNPTDTIDKEKVRSIKIEDYNIPDNGIIEEFVDVRLFGATIPIKASVQGGSGSSETHIGPVQLNWGKSLNNVTLMETSGITSHFASDQGEQGTMGTDYRVYYSFIGFHGIISAKRAIEVKLTNDDVKILDEAFIKSIPLNATRSKIGQAPRLYMRIEYTSADYYIGDLRKFVKLTNIDNLRSIQDVELDVTPLVEKLKAENNKITAIYLWKDPMIKLKGNIEDPAYRNKIINITV